MNRTGLSALVIALAATVGGDAQAQGFGRPTAGIFGGVTSPRGDFGSEVNTGWHAGVLVKARVYRALDLRVDGAYAKFGKAKFVFPITSLEDTVVIRTDGVLRFGTLDAHVNLGPDSAEYPGDNTVTPHVLAGVGMYELDYRTTCTGPCEPAGVTTVPRQNHFGINLGGGATIPVFGVRTFVEGRYHRISRKAEDGDQRSFITLSAGLRVR